MTLKSKRPLRLLPPLLLLTLVCGCAPLKPDSAQPSASERAPVPALPSQARQPKPPSDCLPTCSDGLTRLRTESLDSLTKAASPVSPASAPTTR